MGYSMYYFPSRNTATLSRALRWLGRENRQLEGSAPIGRKMAESKQSALFPVNNPTPANQDQPHHYCGSLLIIISVAEFEHSSLCYHSSLSASAWAFCAARLIFEGT
jgi:hypothetical protein